MSERVGETKVGTEKGGLPCIFKTRVYTLRSAELAGPSKKKETCLFLVVAVVCSLVICFSHYSLLRNSFLLSIFFSNLESIYLQTMQYSLLSDEHGSSVTFNLLYKHRISFYTNLSRDKQFIVYMIIIYVINTRSLGFFHC